MAFDEHGQGPAFRRHPGAPPFVYGHRGLRVPGLPLPENTLGAMARALALGADGIELDVRLCATGEPIVLHDADLVRVAGVPTVAATTSFSALRSHALGGGERVPLLDEALELVLGRDRLLNIELKSDVPDRSALVHAVLRAVRARTPREQELVLFSSFDADICEALARQCLCSVGFLFEARTPDRLPRGIRALHPRHTLVGEAGLLQRGAPVPGVPGGTDGAHSRAKPPPLAADGLLLNVWTVNEPARAAALARAGVDGIITDDPAAIAASVRRRA